MTLSALGIFSAAGAGGVVGGDFDLIETVILTGSQSSVVFSNLGTYSSTYKHLQVRATLLGTEYQRPYLRLNGSATDYAWHALGARGSSVTSSAGTSTFAMRLSSDLLPSSDSGKSTMVVDLLDVYAAKSKTVRTLTGNIGSGTYIGLHSGLWNNSASLTSIEFYGATDAGSPVSLAATSRLSLYGVK